MRCEVSENLRILRETDKRRTIYDLKPNRMLCFVFFNFFENSDFIT